MYLSGLSLRGRKDGHTAGSIGAVAGDDRHILDYLSTEVLAGLPPRTRTFLVRTAVLDRFCASLCDAVTGSAGSRDVLEEIERCQLFLVPLDNTRRWYRYHVLFAEALRHELDQMSRPVHQQADNSASLAALSCWRRCRHGSPACARERTEPTPY